MRTLVCRVGVPLLLAALAAPAVRAVAAAEPRPAAAAEARPASAAPEAWPPADPPDLADRLARAPDLGVEDLGVPVRSSREGMLLWAPNPDGRTYDLLQIYFPRYGGPNTIAVLDLASGEVKTVDTPRGLNFHLCPAVVAPNGKLYISILGDRMRQGLCVYDPATNDLALQAVALPEDLLGETHPLVLGTDGRLYAIGAHPTKAASACQVDPATGRVTPYGAIGPSHAPSGCWGYSGAADDRYVYIASGKVPWYLVAYDRETGRSEVLVETEKVGGYVSVSQGRHGCTGSATKVVGTDGARIDYWLYRGKAVPKKAKDERPPWPEPAQAKPHVAMPPRPEVSLARSVPDADGRAEVWVRAAAGEAAPPAAPAPAAGAAGPAAPGGWRVFRYQVPLYPQDIYRLVELPDGRLLGTAGAYEGNFLHDPATGRSTHLGKCGLSHYATAILDGKVYMSGYPSSPLYVLDPARPWTAGTGEAGGKVLDDGDPRSNPRRLLYLNQYAGTHKMYGAAVGADGKVYFGGQWIRNGAAGGLAWFDPKTGQAGGFWEAFSNYQVNFVTAAEGGRLIVLSTHRVEDTLLGKPKPRQGKIFVFDTAEGKIVREVEPVLDAKGAGLVVGVGGSRILGWTENPADAAGKTSLLYALDAARGEVALRRTLPVPLPVAIGSNQQERFDFRLGPDGRVWTFLGDRLIRIDPRDGSVEVAGKVTPGGRLAFAGKDVYLAGTASLRRVAGLAARAERG